MNTDPSTPNAELAPIERLFARENPFSAADLAERLRGMLDRTGWVAGLLAYAHAIADSSRAGTSPGDGDLAMLIAPRVLHTLGSAIARMAGAGQAPLAEILPKFSHRVPRETAAWLERLGVAAATEPCAPAWAEQLQAAAFRCLASAVIHSGTPDVPPPTCALRSDEIVWGRAPVRIDLCGGWTDTPPYALEFGGCVVNAAVNLNGQPPVQAFARLIGEPVIRIASIDRGTRTEITRLEQLTEFREVRSEFALAKAALLLSCFGPDVIARRTTGSLEHIRDVWGGGLELTTLAAIPQGSGLGTSSIMSAVVLGVLDRVMGRATDTRDLFHRVLRLEQTMSTGGGWQDQVGGTLDGVKLLTSRPGMVPDVDVQFLAGEVLDPTYHGQQVLLYYTGITRLAKNILGRVVAGYLDRDPTTISALAQLRAITPEAARALGRRDLAGLGRVVDAAWELNKQLDPQCSNDVIEALLDRVRPHVHGAKLLGAGGGGFLLMLCKSPGDAAAVRADLESQPPNPRARFFRISVNREGLCVTAC